MYELILKIPIKEILNKLGIRYTVIGSSMGIWEGEKLADGWIVNINGNYVNDFSHDRAKGGPFAFVKAYLKLTDRETFDRFKDNFGIIGSGLQKKMHHKETKKGLNIQYHRNR